MKKAIVYIKDRKSNKALNIALMTETSSPRNITSNGYAIEIDVSEDLKDIDQQYLEAVIVEEQQFVQGNDEYWTNGTNSVYDVNDIPTLIDENEDPYLDPDYYHVAAIADIPFIASHYAIQKKAGADQSLREEKMGTVRSKRESLLKEADVEINKLLDMAEDTWSWRNYRQELRDVTESYKKVDGDWKVSVDSLDVDSFEFPTKP